MIDVRRRDRRPPSNPLQPAWVWGSGHLEITGVRPSYGAATTENYALRRLDRDGHAAAAPIAVSFQPSLRRYLAMPAWSFRSPPSRHGHGGAGPFWAKSRRG